MPIRKLILEISFSGCFLRRVAVTIIASAMAPAAIAVVVGHPNHPTAAAPNAVPRLPPTK